jgi:hypothetical protein
MASIGRITRLPIRTNNTSLPVLIEYDTTDILNQILGHPTLRAFFDFTDATTMSLSAGLINSITDLSGKALVASASGSERPTYDAAAVNGQPAATFSAAQKMVATDLFSGSTKLSVAAAIYSRASDNTSRMYVATATDQFGNYYAGGDVLRSHAADVSLSVPNLRNRMVNVVSTLDDDSNALHLYADGLDATGVLTRALPTGTASIGAWHDAVTTNRFDGHIGYLAVFDEDLAGNDTIRGLLEEYTARRWRIS